LQADGHSVSRLVRPGNARAAGDVAWDPHAATVDLAAMEGFHAVVHLGGANISEGRWTPARKAEIRSSRIDTTRVLVDALAALKKKPGVFVCASAIGFYGDRGDEVLTESSPPGHGFLADVCREWEAEADRATESGLRVVKLRIGFVLGKDGGALAQMAPAFRAFVGGRLGSGRQWMPWIHAADVAELFVYAAENEISGVWNATSPNPVSNAEFTRQMGKALRRPAIFPVPPMALKLAFGELGQHMLDSARVIPEAASNAGFPFRYPQLAAALGDLLG
jgi:hypothetical protein